MQAIERADLCAHGTGGELQAGGILLHQEGEKVARDGGLGDAYNYKGVAACAQAAAVLVGGGGNDGVCGAEGGQRPWVGVPKIQG